MTSEYHRDQAVQMLADVNDTEAPNEARVLTQAAIAHALLGLLEIEMQQGDPEPPPDAQQPALFDQDEPSGK
jgi:hypothetical protein